MSDVGGEEARRTHRKVYAPWSGEQVESLNDYQQSGTFHEYTCGIDSSHALLLATESGWICEEDDCPYTQLWAHEWTANRGWEEMRLAKLGVDWATAKADIERGTAELAAAMREPVPDETSAAPKGYRANLCLKLKVRKVGSTEVGDGERVTTIEAAEILSIAFGCEVEHKTQRDVGPDSTVFVHVGLQAAVGFLR